MNRTQQINNSLKEFRRDVPEYVGSGFVDMSTGMLLAIDTVDNHPREIIDILAAATADLFQGRTVSQIEALWKQTRGVSDDRHYFNEILVNSDNLVHLFMRSASSADIVAVVICTRAVSVGMLFAQARQVMREFDSARLSPGRSGWDKQLSVPRGGRASSGDGRPGTPRAPSGAGRKDRPAPSRAEPPGPARASGHPPESLEHLGQQVQVRPGRDHGLTEAGVRHTAVSRAGVHHTGQLGVIPPYDDPPAAR